MEWVIGGQWRLGRGKGNLVGEDVAEVILRDAAKLADGQGPARPNGERGAERDLVGGGGIRILCQMIVR